MIVMLDKKEINFFNKTSFNGCGISDPGPINIINCDTLVVISLYLDPLSFYYFARANKQFLKFITHVNFDLSWNYQLVTHFPIEAGKLTNRSTPNGHYELFIKTSLDYYQAFNDVEKIWFTLVRANDLFSITERKIAFDINLLERCDTKYNSLLSLIRKQNNKALNNFIAQSIYTNNSQANLIDLVACAVKLDQDDDFLNNFLVGKDINEITLNYKTILYFSVQYNSINSVRLLLYLGAYPDVGTHFNSLYLAAQKGYCEIVDLLLNNKHIQVDAAYRNKYSALYIASQLGHIEIVQHLLDHGANVNGIHPKYHPLYIAMQEGKTEVVICLLEHGANVNARYHGCTPLYIGARNNHFKGLKALLAYCKKNRIPLNLEDNTADRSTALYVAAQNGHAEVCHVLLEHGAKIDCEYLGGYTPLYIASQNGHLEVIKVLCDAKHKPSLNRLAPNGSSALYVAAQNGHVSVVEYLSQQPNCNVNTTYIGGYTPLYVACQKGYSKIVDFL